MIERRGDEASAFYLKGDALDGDRLAAAVSEDTPHPLLLCGTAFAFVHWLDALGRKAVRLGLPPGTRVMETGGFKGRARERPRDALYAEIEARLGVPAERIVNQYGMTELGSQFYDTVLHDTAGPRRKARPAWTRVRLVDPESDVAVPEGEPGLVTVLDLANTGSVCAVQTADLGRAIGDGFEVLGRLPGYRDNGSVRSILSLFFQ